jgi:hypothetical protein
VGAEPASQRLYSARAPIHPKRPYGLTRPVVPPDGSFRFGDISRDDLQRHDAVVRLNCAAPETPYDYGPHNYCLSRSRVSIAGQTKTFPQDKIVTFR